MYYILLLWSMQRYDVIEVRGSEKCMYSIKDNYYYTNIIFYVHTRKNYLILISLDISYTHLSIGIWYSRDRMIYKLKKK